MKCRRENADVSGAKTQTQRSRLRVCVLQNADANFLTRVTKTQTQTRLRRHMQRALGLSRVSCGIVVRCKSVLSSCQWFG